MHLSSCWVCLDQRLVLCRCVSAVGVPPQRLAGCHRIQLLPSEVNTRELLNSYKIVVCRYWAVAVPVFGCVCFTMLFFLYIGANLLMVPPPDDMRNLRGQFYPLNHILYPVVKVIAV